MLGIKYLIATEMNKSTGVITGENCYKTSKVKMFRRMFGNDAMLEAFYSDSKSDIPMMRLAEKGYFVFGNEIKEHGEKKRC